MPQSAILDKAKIFEICLHSLLFESLFTLMSFNSLNAMREMFISTFCVLFSLAVRHADITYKRSVEPKEFHSLGCLVPYYCKSF